MKRVEGHVEKQIGGLSRLVDSTTMRVGTIENSLKSLQHSVAALREEFSGIAQVAGGSVARKVEDIDGDLRRLEKSFTEFSTRTTGEIAEAERRSCVTDALDLAQEAYARSITVDAVVTSPSGLELTPIVDNNGSPSLFACCGSCISLRYPMTEDEKGQVTMLHISVAPDGTVTEYSVPVQTAEGVMTVNLVAPHPEAVSSSC